MLFIVYIIFSILLILYNGTYINHQQILRLKLEVSGQVVVILITFLSNESPSHLYYLNILQCRAGIGIVYHSLHKNEVFH